MMLPIESIESTTNTPSGIRPHWCGAGFLTASGGLFLGSGAETSVHESHAYKICIATHGEFLLDADDRPRTSCAAAVIPPDYPHIIDARGATLAIFYLVPEQWPRRMINRVLRGRGVFAPPREVLTELLPRLQRYLTHGARVEEVNEVCEYLFDNLVPPAWCSQRLDARVQTVLEYLDATMDDHPTIQTLSAVARLSPSRLEHLFSDEVGIPIIRYLLWHRVRRAVERMPDHCMLTELAYSVGFADSAHLSRSFRRMLGIPPSMLRHIQLVKG